MDTAEAISAGARNEGRQITGPASIALKSPVADREGVLQSLFSGKWDLWNKMIDDWLNDDTQQTIMILPDNMQERCTNRFLLKSSIRPKKLQ